MRRPTTGLVVLLVGWVVVASVAACSPSAPSPSAPPSMPSASASAAAEASLPPPSERPGRTDGASAAVDPTLLEVLPALIDGIERQADLQTAADIADSGDIAGFADALAVALYVGPPGGDTATEYAVVTVTRVRDGLFGGTFHRDWRDSFDAAVCGQAGGVIGNAEAEIGGRRTFIGTCAGGVRTYHVVLDDERTLVSLQALGEGRLGERIVAELAE